VKPADSAFDKLRKLLDGVQAPPGMLAIDLELGELRLPAGNAGVFALADAEGWRQYPRAGGTEELRLAYGQWLVRRFDVQAGLSSGRIAIEPTPGTKQAVSSAISLAVLCAGSTSRPAAILPNPFYPTYRAATAAVGGRAVYYSTGEGQDAAPIAAAVEAAGGRAAAVVVCNPSSPQGHVLSAEYLRDASRVAAAAGAVLIVDECYIDLVFVPTAVGYLSVVEEVGYSAPYVVLHTLSKRSGAPGLRSGFMAGDPGTVTAYSQYNRSCGVSAARPINAAATALWSDDAHVAHIRQLLNRNWDLADSLLRCMTQYRRASAGFFLWLPVADDESGAVTLWRDYGLRVMPGRYLGTDIEGCPNPGVGHLRVALVHEEEWMREALTRLRDAAPFITADAVAP
jgi:N-succinyldiaminopimelate aminotransferase